MPEARVGFLVQFGELWRQHPLFMAAATLATLLAGNAVVQGVYHAVQAYMQYRSGGDEPPIRVKGGSFELRLLTTQSAQKGYWTKTDNGKARGWTVGPGLGTHKKDKVGLIVVSSTPCPAFYHGKDEITFTFTDTTDPSQPKTWDVVFNSKSLNTNVVLPEGSDPSAPSPFPLEPDSDPHTLVNKTKGYISKIQIGLDQPCNFAEKELDEAFLLEW